MKLTPELKQKIDNMSYIHLLTKWRHLPVDDVMFTGESGIYFGKRMSELRSKPNGHIEHVQASKIVGW
jgi:hypothetical protein